MDAVQRRAALSDYLSQAAGPVSASVLAARFSVSRHPRSDPPAGLCPPAGGHGPGAGAHGG